MKILFLPFSLLFLLTISSPAFCQSNYSRYDTFRSLSFSYSELAVIIKDAEKFLQTVNGKPDIPSDITKKIQIKKDGTQITFSAPDEMKNYERKPEVAYEFTYSYYYPKGKISQINMNFTDTSRKISIEGTDPNQIDALFSMLKEKIENKSSFFGGEGFRALLFLGIFIFLMVYFLLGIELSKKTRLMRLIFTICILTGLSILFFKFDLPPGTAIYSGDASFIVRNSPYISFWGVVFTIVLPFILPYLGKDKSKASSPTALTETQTNGVKDEGTPLEVKDIHSKLIETPPAQVEDAKQNYYGRWAKGTGPLNDVTKNKDNKDLAEISVMCDWGFLMATVPFSKNPGLDVLPRKDPITIIGRISKIYEMHGFYFVDAKLFYDLSISEGKSPDQPQR